MTGAGRPEKAGGNDTIFRNTRLPQAGNAGNRIEEN